jgi:hypothetical protein
MCVVKFCDFFSKEHGSPEFEKFLGLVGDKIRLKGWKRYRGGLDTGCKFKQQQKSFLSSHLNLK